MTGKVKHCLNMLFLSIVSLNFVSFSSDNLFLCAIGISFLVQDKVGNKFLVQDKVSLLEWIYSHIALCFFHIACMFFSHCLHEKMHSHSVHIYMVFLHCVFSYVSSNFWHQQTQSHTGCICLFFPQCSFSVHLHCLTERKFLVFCPTKK